MRSMTTGFTIPAESQSVEKLPGIQVRKLHRFGVKRGDNLLVVEHLLNRAAELPARPESSVRGSRVANGYFTISRRPVPPSVSKSADCPSVRRRDRQVPIRCPQR